MFSDTPTRANLGDSPGALESYRKALAIRELMVAASPGDNVSQRSLLGTYFRLAQVLESMGNFPDALAALGKAQPIAEHLGEGSKDPAIVDMLAGVYYFTGGLKLHTGDPVAALENYRRSASIRDAGVQANPGSFVLRVHLAADYGGVAKCLCSQPRSAARHRNADQGNRYPCGHSEVRSGERNSLRVSWGRPDSACGLQQ